MRGYGSKRGARKAGYPARRKSGRLVLKILLFFFAGALLLLIVLAVRAVSLYVRGFSGIPLSDVSISGQEGLERSELLRIAGLDEGGIDLVDIDLKSVREKLISGEPYIRSATVDRDLSSGVLMIKIELRKPVVLLSADRDGLWGVDREGIVVGCVEKIGFKDLPVLTGLDISIPGPGARAESGKIITAFSILESAGGSNPPIDRLISEINLGNPRNIAVFIGTGRESMQIRFHEDTFRQRMDEAAVLVSSFREEERAVEYIDMRFPGRPVVRFKR